jgi:hypothetical protein
MFLDKLQDWLSLEHNVFILKMVLHDNVQEAGLSYKLLHRRAAEWDEVVR